MLKTVAEQLAAAVVSMAKFGSAKHGQLSIKPEIQRKMMISIKTAKNRMCVHKHEHASSASAGSITCLVSNGTC